VDGKKEDLKMNRIRRKALEKIQARIEEIQSDLQELMEEA
jgi:hypothetical protein